MWNTGIGFDCLDSDLFYNIISALIAIVIFFLIIFALKSDKFDKISFSIIIGGALGNFTIGSFLMQFQILLTYITEIFIGLLLILQIYL